MRCSTSSSISHKISGLSTQYSQFNTITLFTGSEQLFDNFLRAPRLRNKGFQLLYCKRLNMAKTILGRLVKMIPNAQTQHQQKCPFQSFNALVTRFEFFQYIHSGLPVPAVLSPCYGGRVAETERVSEFSQCHPKTGLKSISEMQ